MAEVVITLTPGTVEFGLWCDDCALPSRFRFPVNHLSGAGVSTFMVIDRCDDCGRRFREKPQPRP